MDSNFSSNGRVILFWFYKDVKICVNRLKILRFYNPNTKIFGLFGGTNEDFQEAQEITGELLDDLYFFNLPKDNHWKWKHGDLMINHWYRERGKYLQWTSLVLVQWDMLLFNSIENIFGFIQSNELALSGLRPVEEVKEWWPWVKKDSIEYQNYIKCLDNIKTNTDCNPIPYCCLFIVVVFPRIFLEKYAYISNPEIGFLEYKIPTYAKAWNINFANCSNFNPWWAAHPNSKNIPEYNRTLIAVKQKIPKKRIKNHLLEKNGKRVFHPYFESIPLWKVKLFSRFNFFAKFL